MATDDACPLCGADLRGEPIPEKHREHYGGKTHFSRLWTTHWREGDETIWQHYCPCCKGTWRE